MLDTIEVLGMGGKTMTTTGFQLLQWKHALKLEAVGMTMSRGRKVSTHIKKGLGLPMRTPISELSTIVETVLKASQNREQWNKDMAS